MRHQPPPAGEEHRPGGAAAPGASHPSTVLEQQQGCVCAGSELGEGPSKSPLSGAAEPSQDRLPTPALPAPLPLPMALPCSTPANSTRRVIAQADWEREQERARFAAEQVLTTVSCALPGITRMLAHWFLLQISLEDPMADTDGPVSSHNVGAGAPAWQVELYGASTCVVACLGMQEDAPSVSGCDGASCPGARDSTSADIHTPSRQVMGGTCRMAAMGIPMSSLGCLRALQGH